MHAMTVVKDTLCALDTMARAPTPFEVEILETVTRQCQRGVLPSAKQLRLLCGMVTQYLADPSLLRALQAVRPAPPPSEAVSSGRAHEEEA